MKEDWEITRTLKITIYCLCAPIVFMIFYFGIISDLDTSRQEVIRENNLSENFTGRVRSLYRDTRNHNVKVAVLSNAYLFQIIPIWERNIEVGDSLLKRKGSYRLEVFKNGGAKIILDYHDNYKHK